MRDIRICSDAELEEELLRRKRERQAKPKLKDNIDTLPLAKALEQYIDTLGTDDYDDDYEHFIFEEAISVFYGKEAWSWINSRLR